MHITSDEMTGRIEEEIGRIDQLDLAARLRRLLVPVRCEEREWDYGQARTFPCWIIAEHRASNTAFAYCEQGFGPRYPWGMLRIAGTHLSMGADDRWFASFEEAFRSSAAWDGINPNGYEVS